MRLIIPFFVEMSRKTPYFGAYIELAIIIKNMDIIIVTETKI